jgi:hypothetical protein
MGFMAYLYAQKETIMSLLSICGVALGVSILYLIKNRDVFKTRPIPVKVDRTMDWKHQSKWFVLLLSVVWGVSANAQVHVYPVIGDKHIDHKLCYEVVGKVDVILQVVHFNEPKWDFYVACDPQIWQSIQDRAGNRNKGAFTDLDTKSTYLNSAMFMPDFNFVDGFTAELAVAHEIGHIVLKTGDERKATCWARKTLYGKGK